MQKGKRKGKRKRGPFLFSQDGWPLFQRQREGEKWGGRHRVVSLAKKADTAYFRYVPPFSSHFKVTKGSLSIAVLYE